MPSCFNSFWHGVIPTSYFIFNDRMCIITVAKAPKNMMAVQESPTSIRVTWTPSTGANGYIISYSTGSSSDRVNVSDDSTDNYLLKGLLNGATYNMSIVATSQHFFSNNAIVGIVHLGKNVAFVQNSDSRKLTQHPS